MSQESPSSGRRWFTLAVIVVITIVMIGAIGYTLFIQLAGTDEASQDISMVVDEVDGENLYIIMPEQSAARFYIDEVLRGEDFTVVGETSEVGGQMNVNFEDPGETEIGQIVINARTLTTDNEDRNRALRLAILRSREDAYEFITFNPRILSIENEVEGAIDPGTTLEVRITGDMTIIEATREVIFAGEVTYNEDDTISGVLDTTIRYADFDIGIQAPPVVSDIEEEVRLEIDFVAMPTNGAADSESTTDTTEEASEAEETPEITTTEEAE